MDRLEELKKEAIENPGKKVRGCKSCKKKKEINEPLPPLEFIDPLDIPTPEDMKLAYAELGSKELTEEKRIFINRVYSFLFNEDFDFGCRSCVNTQGRKFHNHLKYNLKLI